MDLFAKAVKSGIAKGYAIGKQELQQHLAKQRESSSQSDYDNTSSDHGAHHTAPYPVLHTLSKVKRKKGNWLNFDCVRLEFPTAAATTATDIRCSVQRRIAALTSQTVSATSAAAAELCCTTFIAKPICKL